VCSGVHLENRETNSSLGGKRDKLAEKIGGDGTDVVDTTWLTFDATFNILISLHLASHFIFFSSFALTKTSHRRQLHENRNKEKTKTQIRG